MRRSIKIAGMAVALVSACLAAPPRVEVITKDKVLVANSLNHAEPVRLSNSESGPWEVSVIKAKSAEELPFKAFAQIQGEPEVYRLEGGTKYVILVDGGRKKLKSI